jgi:hypothetical protein
MWIARELGFLEARTQNFNADHGRVMKLANDRLLRMAQEPRELEETDD